MESENTTFWKSSGTSKLARDMGSAPLAKDDTSILIATVTKLDSLA